MWFSSLTRDLGDFTHSFVEDTRSLASIVTRMAAEVTGQSPLVAGDEDSLLAQQCPLDKDAVHALQRNDAVYLEAIDENKERKLFDEWCRRSVYSSANVHAQEQSTGDRSGSGSDEAAMTYRQRLLDESAIMREKFEAFVQVPLCDKEVSPDAAEKGPVDCNEPVPTAIAIASASAAVDRIAEDEFFDRYFFRLSQLRLRVAESLREREAEIAQKAKHKKSLAERLIEATDELVGWGDDGATTAITKSPMTTVKATRRDAEWEEQERQVTALEELVRVLQREIAAERARTTAVIAAARDCGLQAAQLERLEAAAARPEEKEKEKEKEKEREREKEREAPLDVRGEGEERTPGPRGRGAESSASSPNTQTESDEWTKL